MGTVQRFEDIVTDAELGEIVAKYSVGQDVNWGRRLIEQTLEVRDPISGAVLGHMVAPGWNIYLHIRGHDIDGPGKDLYWRLTVPATASHALISQEIMTALERLREQKAAQARLGPLGKIPHGPTSQLPGRS